MVAEDLEASRDPLSFVVHQGQYVPARVDVQRLLMKSVRFSKVSVIEMPVDRGVAVPVHGLEHRAAATAVELTRNQHPTVHIRIEQRQRSARGAVRDAIGPQRG